MPDPYNTTVTVSAASRDLTVLDTVKQELNITDNESNALLQRYITEQSDVVNIYCDRKFAIETIADSFHVDIGTCYPLLLSRKPISSITSIVEISTTLDQSTYDIDFSGGRVWRIDGGLHSWWPAGKIVVTYVGGYELLTTLPPGIERATILLIKQAWFSRERDPRIKSESIDGIGSMSVSPETSYEAEELLRPYKSYFC